MYILGLDPGLNHTGWGILHSEGSSIQYVSHGVISVPSKQELAVRLAELHKRLQDIISAQTIDQAAVEETFVNKSPTSTLKLGMARGIVLAAPAIQNIPVFEYSANKVKKTVTGSGHASKDQVAALLQYILPTMPRCKGASDDTDALAIALCHIQHSNIMMRAVS